MNTAKLYMVAIYVFTFVCACAPDSETSPYNPTTSLPSTGLTQDPLLVSQVLGDFFDESYFFSAYVPSAGRVTVISPSQEAEVNGVDYDDAILGQFALSGVEGIGIWTKTNIVVRGLSATKDFSHGLSGDLIGRYSSEAVGIALTNSSTGASNVLRYLGDGEWDQVNVSKQAESGSFAPFLSEDGTTLLVLNTEDASYVIYRADSEGEALAHYKSCTDDMLSGLDESLNSQSITSLAIDPNVMRVFVSLDTSLLSISFDGSEDCDLNNGLASISVAEAEFSRIELLSENVVAGLLDDGSYREFERDGDVLIEKKSIDTECEEPVSINLVNSDQVVIGCVAEKDGADLLEAEFVFISRERDVVESRLVINVDETANIAIAPEQGLMFQVIDNAFGRMRIFDTATGESRTVDHMFLNSILE